MDHSFNFIRSIDSTRSKQWMITGLLVISVACVCALQASFAEGNGNDALSTNEHFIEIKDSYGEVAYPYAGEGMLEDLLPVRQTFGNNDVNFYLKNPRTLEAPDLLPLIQNMNEADVSLRATNPTKTPYFLSVPSQNQKLYVPIQSERTLTVDMSNVQEGQLVPYYLLDIQDEKIAGGYILNGVIIKKTHYSASQQQHMEWSNKLQQLILSNEYKAPYLPKKPEPKYSDPIIDETPVRGYW